MAGFRPVLPPAMGAASNACYRRAEAGAPLHAPEAGAGARRIRPRGCPGTQRLPVLRR